MRKPRSSVWISGFALLLAHFVSVSIAQGQQFELADEIDTGFDLKWPAPSVQEDLAFSPDGKLLSASFYNKAVLVSPQIDDDKPSVRNFSVLSAKRPIRLSIANGSGSLLATDGKPIWKWDIETKQLQQIEVDATVPYYMDVALSHDEKTIALGHIRRRREHAHVSLYDVATRTVEYFGVVKCLKIYPNCRPDFDDIQFLPDGTKIVTDTNYYDDDFGTTFRIQIWDVDSKKMLKQFRGRNSCCSPDSKLLAFEDCGADGKIDETTPKVRLLDTTTLEILDPLPGENLNSPAAWSANGKWLAILGRDNSVNIWDVKEKKVVGQIPVQRSGILAASFSPDGTRIASSYNDGKIRIWQKKK